MRNISFSLTTPQFIDGTKDVTRRLGWLFLKAGDRLMACEQCQGIKAGGLVRLGVIEVVSIRRGPLYHIKQDDCRREGFPDLSPEQFVDMFCEHMGCTIDKLVTRIEFKRL